MTFRKNQIGKARSFRFCVKSWPVVPFGLVVALLAGEAYGQTPPPITSSGLNTQISAPVNVPSGAVQRNIIGGTRPGGRGNLFHSFGEFGVPTNNIANFLNDSALPTSNILSRVTGGNPSNILGTIQTEGFGNANLFLMNPAGIVFGPNATLNVGGSTHFTTADYLQLSDGVQFTALPGPQDALLSVAPVEAFGFLHSNPPVLAAGNSAAILVEGLDVLNGNPVSLIGRDAMVDGTSVSGVVITEGVLRNPGGSVRVVSVGGQQLPEVQQVLVDVETLNVQGNNAQGLKLQEPVQLGGIVLSEGGTIDVSGEVGGSVVIRGGQLMIDGGGILSNTNGPGEGAVAGNPQAVGSPQTAIDIETESLVIQDGGSIVAGTYTSSNGGDVRLKASESLQIRDEGYVLTFTEGDGNAGNIEVDAGQVQLSESGTSAADRAGISSQTDFFEPFVDFTGNAGHIRLNAQQLEISGFSRLFTQTFTSGNAGDIDVTVKGGSLVLSGAGAQILTQQNLDFASGVPGNIKLKVEGGDVILKDGGGIFSTNIGTGGTGIEGGIQITADNLEIFGASSGRASIISVDNFSSQKTGGITITLSGNLKMQDVAQINVISRTDADANDLNITANDIFVSGNGGLIATKATSEGRGGNLNILAENLTVTGQNSINSQTEGTGDAGNINITVGELSLLNGATVTAESIATENGAGNAGNAGNVNIATRSMVMEKGAQINSGTTSTGAGGAITVDASDNISITGTLDGTPSGVLSQTTGTEPGSGAGGAISLTAGQNFTLSDGAAVSASSAGTGNSGSISITTNSGDVQVNQGSITTAAIQAEAGNITISAAQSVSLSNLGGLLSLTLGDGKAGDIAIQSENLLLDGGGIFANSGGPNSTGQLVVGTGDAGNIVVEARNMVSLSNNGIISSSTVGNGRGGDIVISAKQLAVSTASQILTDTGSFDVTGPVSGQGQGGTVMVTAQDSVDLNGAQILTRTLGDGDAGAIVVETNQLNISNGGGLFATSGIPDVDGNLVTGIGSAGDITVTATEFLSLSGTDSFISSATGGAGNGGMISLQTGRLMVADHAGVIATSGLFDPSGNFIVGQGNSGSINISAAESASVSNGGLVSSSTGGGIGGVVSLSTPELALTGGSIQARTVGDAPGGSISIQTGNVTMSNGAEMNTGSGLQDNQTGILLAGKGDGGNISVSASQSINLSTGAKISTESLGEGKAGLVNLATEGNFQGDESTVSTSAQQGTGGNIIIASGKDVQLRNNTTVSAESFGTGNAGNITITAPDTILIDKAIVTTKADQASGGNIKLTADNLIQLTDSQVTSRVREGSGSAGSINFDPDFIVIKNSQVLSTAEFGDGGPITLTANSAILVDPFSRLDASSQFGGSGKIDLQAPIQNLSGTIVPLPQDPVPVTALYGSRCVAGAGGHFSTFVDSKADSLAPTPGTFLASPFLPLSSLSKSGELGDAGMPTGVSGKGHAAPLKVAAYSPPVLFGQGDAMLSACP